MRWRDFDDLPLLPDTFFDTPRRVHFIGIGGIGMSALASALRANGHKVSGSDSSESPVTVRLRGEGVVTSLGHREENIRLLDEPAEALIYSSAIPTDNPEREAARKAGIVEWHRAQLLAYFANRARVSIAVSGTHGKSTTSAMIAHILERRGQNPTAILGAEYTPFGSNVRIGDPELVVVEADESDGSFTLLTPTVAVITNVEAEHLENYSDSEEELWRAFNQFADSATEQLIVNGDDHGIERRIDLQGAIRYGFGSSADIRAADQRVEDRSTTFDVTWHTSPLGRCSLGVPGEHNVSNALAALAAADTQTGEFSEAAQFRKPNLDLLEVLKDFHGVKRRFEFMGESDGVLVYNDYGHHPTEVARTLETARDFLQRPIVAVFQPHRYSRTQQLGRDFASSFDAASATIVTELYSAFEEPIPGVSGRIVFDAVAAHQAKNSSKSPLHFAADLDEALHLALDLAKPGTAIFCLGAGSIGGLPPKILDGLTKRQNQRQADARPGEEASEADEL